jgi:hypothetical protein
MTSDFTTAIQCFAGAYEVQATPACIRYSGAVRSTEPGIQQQRQPQIPS